MLTPYFFGKALILPLIESSSKGEVRCYSGLPQLNVIVNLSLFLIAKI